MIKGLTKDRYVSLGIASFSALIVVLATIMMASDDVYAKFSAFDYIVRWLSVILCGLSLLTAAALAIKMSVTENSGGLLAGMYISAAVSQILIVIVCVVTLMHEYADSFRLLEIAMYLLVYFLLIAVSLIGVASVVFQRKPTNLVGIGVVCGVLALLAAVADIAFFATGAAARTVDFTFVIGAIAPVFIYITAAVAGKVLYSDSTNQSGK